MAKVLGPSSFESWRTFSLSMKSFPRIARREKATFDVIAATNCSMLKFCKKKMI